MFDSVPRRYDFLNRLLTLTLDQYWRRRAAKLCLQSHPLRVLDLCYGTGNLAFQLAVMAKGPMEIVGLDFSPSMLQIARKKDVLFGYWDNIAVEGGWIPEPTTLAITTFWQVCMSTPVDSSLDVVKITGVAVSNS